MPQANEEVFLPVARRKVDQAVSEVDALIAELEELRTNLYASAEFQRQD